MFHVKHKSPTALFYKVVGLSNEGYVMKFEKIE